MNIKRLFPTPQCKDESKNEKKNINSKIIEIRPKKIKKIGDDCPMMFVKQIEETTNKLKKNKS